jgi:hypothetical protein
MKEIHELDLTNQAAEWIQKLGSLQTPRENHACMVFKDYVIISGGNDLLASGSETWDSVERLTNFKCIWKFIFNIDLILCLLLSKIHI